MTRSLAKSALLLVFLAASCGGGGSGRETTGPAAGSSEESRLAALGIIAKDTAVRAMASPTFRDGADGEVLGQGDTVKTSLSGFAELAYFDGSFTRIDSGAELTLTRLERTDQTRHVESTLVSGRSWNRVSKAATAADSYAVDTPVATASVRGTAFQIDCTPTDRCVFSVVEGTIVLRITGREDLVLTAPAEVAVARDLARTVTPRTVTLAELLLNPFTERNLQIDASKNLAPIAVATTSTTAATTTSTVVDPVTSTTVPVAPTSSAPAVRPTAPVATVPPDTVPVTTAPPTTAPPPPGLNLGGTWNASWTVSITAQTGCYAGATASISGASIRLQGVAPFTPCVSNFNNYVPTSLAWTCSGVQCKSALGNVITRTGPTTAATSWNRTVQLCFAQPDGTAVAELAADESGFTVPYWENMCSASGNLQMVYIATFTR